MNNLKRLRQEDEAKLTDLRKTRDNIANLGEAKIKLDQLYARVLDDLENSTSEIKRLAFGALGVKVYASTESTEITGVIPLELYLPTTERTSATMLKCRFSYTEAKGYVLSMGSKVPDCRDHLNNFGLPFGRRKRKRIG